MATILATRTSEQKAVSPPSTGWLAGLGVAAGFGALAASSCCVLPLALSGIGATSAMFSGLETLANIRPVLLGGAAVALMAGWGLFFTRRARSYCAVNGDCLAPTTSVRTATLLGLGTAIIGLALVWEPFFEPMLLKFVR